MLTIVNGQGTFKGTPFEAYFWQATDACNEYVFNKAMQEMKKLSADAYQYLKAIPLELWARFKFDPSVCSLDNTYNFTESFNATLGMDRVKPMLTLAEGELCSGVISPYTYGYGLCMC